MMMSEVKEQTVDMTVLKSNESIKTHTLDAYHRSITMLVSANLSM